MVRRDLTANRPLRSNGAMPESRAPTGEVFEPPTSLRERIGPRSKIAESKALEQAKAALDGLSGKFDSWLEEDLANLCEARDALIVRGVDEATIDRLFTHALDLKGLGATYNYPLVTRFAASLCKLLGDGDTQLLGPVSLTDAHVSAIKATVRGQVRDRDDPTGVTLARELELHTKAVLPEQAQP